MKTFIALVCIVAMLQISAAQSCNPDQYECANERCIPGQWICDGDNDCGDMSDERDANGNCPSCPDALFPCAGGRCIYSEWICDGDNDCGDWSDETEDACPCADDEIRCSKKPGEEDGPPGACIPGEWVCDPEGIWDCPNGDDEANCTVKVVGNRQSKIHRVKTVKGKRYFWYKAKRSVKT